MFCDETEVKFGGDVVKVRRATLDEMRNGGLAVLAFIFSAKQCLHDDTVEFVRAHCATPDGKPVDVGALSLPQMQRLAREIGGVPDGVPLADFIALLL